MSEQPENEPQTPFGIWLKAALYRNKKSLTQLARDLEMDYTGLWKISRGDPETYPNNLRPDYDNTLRIGQLLGDVEGALKAAGYETPAARTIRQGDRIRLQTGDIIEFLGPNGEPGEVELTPELLDFLNTYAIGKKTRNQQEH